MLKGFFFVIRLSGHHNTILSVLPSSHISITCRNKKCSILLIRQIKHVKHSYTCRQYQIFLANRHLSSLLFLNRRNADNQLFWCNFQNFRCWLSRISREEVNGIGSLFIVGFLINIREILQFRNDRIYSDMRSVL